jgi:hypothetical protein
MQLVQEYYWDKISDKYDVTRDSGLSKFENALESWFRRVHGVKLTYFNITSMGAVSTRFQIEVPISGLGMPANLSEDEFFDLIDSDEYNKAGLIYIEELLDVDRILQSWDAMYQQENPNMVILSYEIG